jgi:hypothetical protein
VLATRAVPKPHLQCAVMAHVGVRPTMSRSGAPWRAILRLVFGGALVAGRIDADRFEGVAVGADVEGGRQGLRAR